MNTRLMIGTMVGALALTSQAVAATLTFDFNTVVSSDTPGGTAPWASAVFTDVAANTVDLVVTHNSGSQAGQFISLLRLNVDASVTGVSANAIGGKVATFDGASFGQATDAGRTFDFSIDFKTTNAGSGASRLLPGDSITIRLTGTGLDALDFDEFSTGGSPLRALMHVQNTPGQAGSGKVTESVPEPATMLVLSGIAALVAARKKRS
jgi:hypothetical protein